MGEFPHVDSIEAREDAEHASPSGGHGATKIKKATPTGLTAATKAASGASSSTSAAPRVSAEDFDEVFQDRDPDNDAWIKPRSRGLWMLTLLLFIGGGITAAWALGAFAPAPSAIRGEKTHTVSRKPFSVTILEQGALESGANVHLRCEVSGGAYISFVIPDGTEVKKGDVVVQFDSAQFETDVSEQEVKVRGARSTVVAKESELSIAKINLEEYTHGTFVKELKEAEVEIQVAEENLRAAVNVRDYTQRMMRKGYVSALELESKEFAARKAQLELEKATVKRDALRDYTYKKQVEDFSGKLAAAEAALEGAKETLTLEEARLTQLKDALSKCTLVAPQDGLAVLANDPYRESMSEGGIAPGSRAWQSQTLIWLPDLTNMQVSVPVHESRIRQLHPGMKAKVTVQDREFEGEVVSIANQPDGQFFWLGQSAKKYTTIVKILGAPQGLKPGLTAKVEIVTESQDDAITVPQLAVTEADGKKYCYVRTGDTFEKRQVILGSMNTSDVVIVDGVEPGEEILLHADMMERDTQQPGPAKTDDKPAEVTPVPKSSAV